MKKKIINVIAVLIVISMLISPIAYLVSVSAAETETCTVTLKYTDGSDYKSFPIEKGESFTFPDLMVEDGSTFMYWTTVPNLYVSRTRHGPTAYETGSVLPHVNSDLTFYAAIHKNAADPFNEANLAAPSDRYAGIIFVGDSRMNGTEDATKEYRKRNPVFIIAKGGTKIQWVKEEAYQRLLTMISEIRKRSRKPIAVVFSHGINTLRGDNIDYSDYLSYMKLIVPELKKWNCKLFYLSVGPGNPEQMREVFFQNPDCWHAVIDMEAVRDFNTDIKTKLTDYTFIDSYHYLMTNGYGCIDGIHYTPDTYRAILNFALNEVNRGQRKVLLEKVEKSTY